MSYCKAADTWHYHQILFTLICCIGQSLITKKKGGKLAALPCHACGTLLRPENCVICSNFAWKPTATAKSWANICEYCIHTYMITTSEETGSKFYSQLFWIGREIAINENDADPWDRLLPVLSSVSLVWWHNKNLV